MNEARQYILKRMFEESVSIYRIPGGAEYGDIINEAIKFTTMSIKEA